MAMEEFYRIAVATPALHLGDPDANAGELLRMAEAAAEKGVAVIAFPELSLTGYTCGDLFFRSDLIREAATALTDFAHRTKDLPLVSIVGFPERWGDGLYNSAAVVVGGEIAGKTLGVIGLGAIGVMVANAAVTLGMEVIGYDPFLSVDAALRLSRSVNLAKTQEELLSKSDFLTLHLPQTAKTRGMINKETLAAMKPA